MNPDKSHGCKWDLKAASANVLEAIDKTALFRKVSLSLSPVLQTQHRVLRREKRASQMPRTESARRESSLRCDGNRFLELPGCTGFISRDAIAADVPTISRLSRLGRRIAESSGHTILIRAMTRPHRDEPYWECLHRSAVLLIPKPARCCRRSRRYGTRRCLLTLENEASLSAYVGKTSVRAMRRMKRRRDIVFRCRHSRTFRVTHRSILSSARNLLLSAAQPDVFSRMEEIEDLLLETRFIA